MSEGRATTWRATHWIGRGRCFAVPESNDPAREHRALPIEGAIPGERVEAVLQRTPYKRWLRTTRVIEPAPGRAPLACEHAARCPGCALLHTTPELEDRYKRQVVAEVFTRTLERAFDPDEVTCIAPTRRGGHRWSVRLDLEADAHGVRVGLRGVDGIVHAPRCPANHPAIARVLDALVEALATAAPAALARGPAAARVQVVVGRSRTGRVATALDLCWARDACPVRVAQSLADASAWQWTDAVAIAKEDDAPQQARWELFQHSVPPLPPRIGPLALGSTLGAWSPPTPRQSADVYAWVRAQLKAAAARDATALSAWRVLDVGCATGGLSLTLALAGADVVGIDMHYAAVESATDSAERLAMSHALRATFRGGKAETVLPRMVRDAERFDAVVINPLRRALGPETMAAVAALGARVVVYLAPSTIAGAQDVRALEANGFRLAQLGVANLHPGGSAQLTVALLDRPTPAAPTDAPAQAAIEER